MEITKEQFLEYEYIRKRGKYNMLDPHARALSALTKEEWSAIMWNYKEHADKWLKEESK